ncbi:MAG TPA: pantoate--beta-alanine ligase [Lutibacter sp.]|nr:pantoate--beta-alanine ligase [Lutibacter sp.]
MQVFTTINSLQLALKIARTSHTIGFVPTMGALHEGHMSLIKSAKKKSDKIVVSIFVNPTQFDKQEDLTNYPSTIQTDIELLESESCDFLFIPSVKEMYAENVKAKSFDFDGLDQVMEGAHRQGHFNGVGTVVKQLFEIVKPNSAFFGEKDFQQLQIIKKMVEKEKFSLQIIGVPIFRESDGLAMSSRNARLTDSFRKEAPFIYETLQKAKVFFGMNSALNTIEWVEDVFSKHPTLKLEYFSIANETDLKTATSTNPNEKYRAFIAVFAGKIRLIDNIALY